MRRINATNTMEELKYHYKYPHPAVTADCVIFGFDGLNINVLLIQRGIEPFKDKWALPGGFVKIDESADEGARRELQEETGLTDAKIEQFYTFTDVNRDPRERVITIAYYALVRLSEVKGGDDASSARWFSYNEIPGLAFDHDRILREALSHLKRKICFEPIGSYRHNTPFKGTFDGNGHTIYNLKQNTWALDNGYSYGDLGLGLFGKVEENID